MMQLLCNGKYLDLYADAGVQFTHENPLFAFDNFKCERTTQFKLPSTPTNDAVLSLARIPAYAGTGMRQKFTAQIIDGTVIKDGYLYVSSFDGKDYAAIFVTGELLGLQAIKNLGKLADIMTYQDAVTIGTGVVSPALARGTLFKNVYYGKPDEDLLAPSIELKGLYESVVTAYSLNAQAFPASLYGMRIVIGALNGVEQQTITFAGTGHNMASDGTYPDCYTTQTTLVGDILSTSVGRNVARTTNGGVDRYTGAVRQFVAKQPLTITFPEDWNDNLFVGRFIGGTLPQEQNLLAIFEFLGERSFNEQKNITGESLRGRSIELATGDEFTIIHIDDYMYEQESGGLTQGWVFGDVGCQFEIEGGEITTGDAIRLQDNLPDITFTELCKTIAALCSCVLNYDKVNGLSFEPLTLSGYAVKELNNLTKRGEVARTFSDYAQRNIVCFNSNEGVTYPLSIAYTITNDNIDKEKTLLQMPFSEGDSADGKLWIKGEREHMTLGADGGGQYLQKVALTKISGLQQLCTASTQVKTTSRMLLMEYETITAKTLLNVDGSVYAWTSRSWQKDTAQFTLART